MSVPPSTSTIASNWWWSTSAWYASRSGCTPARGNAYTVPGKSLSASHRASARSGKNPSMSGVAGVTSATFGASHSSRPSSSSWVKEKLPR
jgi:hypothetical protein